MFKRRIPRTLLNKLRELVYPHGGWRRALNYISYRVKRIPDSPHKIALGVACGVYVCFTPFFGFHFFLAMGLAFILRANLWAAIIGTFFGNPITFPLIALISYNGGAWILQSSSSETVWREIRSGFSDAWGSIWHNIKTLFGYGEGDWQGFVDFITHLVLPYMLGGLLPGLITAGVIYFILKSLIRIYQKRRKGRIVKKWKELHEAIKTKGQADE